MRATKAASSTCISITASRPCPVRATRSPRAMTSATLLPMAVPEVLASRSISPVESCTMARSSTRRLAWVPLPAPGGPRRMIFAMSASAPCGGFGPALFAAQLRLFDQAFILVRQKMRLDLVNRVHRHRHNDQHRGATEVEGDRKLAAKHFGQKADRSKIGRAKHQNTRHHVI